MSAINRKFSAIFNQNLCLLVHAHNQFDCFLSVSSIDDSVGVKHYFLLIDVC